MTRLQKHELSASFAILLALFSGCSIDDARQKTAFSQVAEEDVEAIFSATRSYLAVDATVALADPEVWEGPAEDVSAITRSPTCGLARITSLIWANDEPEKCPRCESISHEFGHWLAWATANDWDYEHKRFGTFSEKSGWYYAFPFEVCKK